MSVIKQEEVVHFDPCAYLHSKHDCNCGAVRVAELEAENKRLRQERDEYHEKLGDVTGNLMRALVALKRITERKGRFSRDELQWAKNVIDEAVETAEAALDELDPDWRTEGRP